MSFLVEYGKLGFGTTNILGDVLDKFVNFTMDGHMDGIKDRPILVMDPAFDTSTGN